MKEQGIGSEEYAEVFLREVFKHDGLLDVIQSDIDTRLTSDYHSSSNPPNDRVQRVLEELLRTNTQFPTLEWDTYLPVVEFAINNADNLTTG